MKLMIGDNIRKYRKALGLTQEDLAEAVGVTVGAVSKWESKMTNPDISIIIELADLFGISDAAPDFTFSRIRFYSSDQKFFAADDFGQTAVQGIINQLSDSKNSDKFLELLERIQHENQ